MQCLTKFSVAKKFMDKKGGGSIKIFRRKTFVSQCRKISQGNLCAVSEISGFEKC